MPRQFDVSVSQAPYPACLQMGSIGARHPDGLRAWFIAGASGASLIWFALLGVGACWLAPWFARPRAWQVLDGLIGVTMLMLSALLLRHARVGIAPAPFMDKVPRAIVGIEIPIDRLEGKLKASQDEAMPDRLGTVRGLREQAGDTARAMAALVEKAIDVEGSSSS